MSRTNVCIFYYFYNVVGDFNQQFMDGQCDLEMTSLYCKLAEDRSPSVELNSKQHWWNTMFYAGIIIAKVKLGI